MKNYKSFYTKKYWYENTYNSLGSEWLIGSLNKLSELGKLNLDNYTLVNLSANRGYYEWDAYNSHKSYNPTYYLGDIIAEDLKDKKGEGDESFHYLEGNTDATKFDTSNLKEKADVIVDCKGALWHQLLEYDKNGITNLLSVYINLLNDDGILLIDCYTESLIEMIHNLHTWKEEKYNTRKNITVSCFGENSTYFFLYQLNVPDFINEINNPIKLNMISNKPLSSKMGTSYITKEDLTSLILKNTELSCCHFKLVKKFLKYHKKWQEKIHTN
ncbi:hypothetical protein [Ligilactobacillus ruminis]|uniref:hypothetical protein n=1 Tax=Ligilactobacillus ruminis TaxID=1623 RepID=UPI003F948550